MSKHQNISVDISEHFLSPREKSLQNKVVHLETQLQVFKSQIGKPVWIIDTTKEHILNPNAYGFDLSPLLAQKSSGSRLIPLAIALGWKWQIASLKNKLGDKMMKQLLNSVIAKYRDLSVSRKSIICLSLRLRQIIELLATDTNHDILLSLVQ